MDFIKGLGIRNKLILAFVVVVLVPLLGFGFFLDLQVEKQSRQDFA